MRNNDPRRPLFPTTPACHKVRRSHPITMIPMYSRANRLAKYEWCDSWFGVNATRCTLAAASRSMPSLLRVGDWPPANAFLLITRRYQPQFLRLAHHLLCKHLPKPLKLTSYFHQVLSTVVDRTFSLDLQQTSCNQTRENKAP